VDDERFDSSRGESDAPLLQVKRCSKCKVENPVTEFYKNRSNKDGLQGYCKICSVEAVNRYDRSPVGKAKKQIYFARPEIKERLRASAKAYRESPKGRAKTREISRAQRERNPFAVVCWNAKTRARNKNLPFDLDEASVRGMYFDHCPVCGQEMRFGGDNRTSPSIDQIIPALGYTKVNCHVICYLCNRRKNDSTPEQMYQIADYIYKLRRERGLEDAGTRSDD
jgi:hypothetical protein